MYVYVELWKATPKWLALSRQEREDYMGKVGAGMQSLSQMGIEVVAWGSVDPATYNKVPYDFFAVWNMPAQEAARGFEEAIRQAGWFDYFEQVCVGGVAEKPAAVIARHIALA